MDEIQVLGICNLETYRISLSMGFLETWQKKKTSESEVHPQSEALTADGPWREISILDSTDE